MFLNLVHSVSLWIPTVDTSPATITSYGDVTDNNDKKDKVPPIKPRNSFSDDNGTDVNVSKETTWASLTNPTISSPDVDGAGHDDADVVNGNEVDTSVSTINPTISSSSTNGASIKVNKGNKGENLVPTIVVTVIAIISIIGAMAVFCYIRRKHGPNTNVEPVPPEGQRYAEVPMNDIQRDDGNQ